MIDSASTYEEDSAVYTVFHTDELLFELYSHLGLKDLIKAREISKFHKGYVDTRSNRPIFSTLEVRLTEAYIRANDRSVAIKTILPKAAFNYLSITPSDEKKDEFMFHYRSKWVNVDDGIPTETSVETRPLSFFDTLYSNELKRKAQTLSKEYNTLNTREQRGAFIDTYKSINPIDLFPRWHLLKGQTTASLDRLNQSLSRYTDTRTKALSSDVNKCLAQRIQHKQ